MSRKSDPLVLRLEKNEIYTRLVRESLELRPGAADLIKELAQRYTLAIASHSSRAFIEIKLQKFSLTPYFQCFV